MRRELPTWIVALVIVIVLVVIGAVYLRALRTPPPVEVHPITGEPIGEVKQGVPAPSPEHMGR